MSYTMGSLFAGIGGFDLGFERAGFKTVWQVEIDPYCQKVLAKNFPEAERFGDIRECGSHNLKPVDVICGGFPCQDISNAGKRAGIEGERSGLWGEYARIISELRPKFVLVENVAALLGRGMGRVLGDLAEIGYDAEWEIISAADVGAPHLRERVWILAYDSSVRRGAWWPGRLDSVRAWESEHSLQMADTAGKQGWWLQQSGIQPDTGASCEVANADNARLERWDGEKLRQRAREWLAGQGCSCAVSNTSGRGEQSRGPQRDERRLQDKTLRGMGYSHNWETEPNVGRVAHGIPARVDRLRGLGNAVVPQIPEMIAHRIRESLEVAA